MDFFIEFFEALKNDLGKIFGETITLGDNPITTLNIIIWSLYIGFMIGIAVTLYNRLILGGLIRKLIDRGAMTEGSALTCAEVGCKNPLIRFSLREKSTLRRIVHMSGDTETTRSREPFDKARFYIPDENIHRAEVIRQFGHGACLDSVVDTRFLHCCADFILCDSESASDADQLHKRNHTVE